MRVPAIALLSDKAPDSFWVSLRYFNIYRIAVVAVFLGTALFYRDELPIGQHNLLLFLTACGAYLLVACVFQAAMFIVRELFNLQLSLHVCADIVAITVLMYASGGMKSGLGVMLLISLTGAALVAARRLNYLYAALSAIAVLIEQGYWVLVYDSATSSFLQPGLLSIGYFATAGITSQLAQRVVANETLARQRGRELRSQQRVNQLVLGDMQDGVLVLDREGRVAQANPQAARLLGLASLAGARLGELLPEVGEKWSVWRRDAAGRGSSAFDVSARGRDLRVRLIDARTEEELTVAFIEDMTRLREQAQQLKLAALGRLTANIAHEIRNPLSAISHAAELLDEEQLGSDRLRLTRIIRDNTQRLERLVSDVLQFNRRDRIEPERIHLTVWLKGFLEEFVRNESVAAERLVLVAKSDVFVRFDRAHLHQVLWNLLRNAVRHASASAEGVRIAVTSRADQVELNVIDDGPGVSKANQGQLFEPFFTTYSAGTGLGLYLARELCAANCALLEYVDDLPGAHFRMVCAGEEAVAA
ncbi:MAG: PAS domain-containing protein [Betaproteobacteria bacterium]|nr:PAS domain-containing protein [Betaproteobacteria bacterium]